VTVATRRLKTVLKPIAEHIFSIWFWIRWESFRKPPFSRNYYGYKCAYWPGDTLIYQLNKGYSYERDTIASAIKDLPTDAVIFDIGSNIGLIALALARQIPNSQIYCFEPSPHAYGCLTQTVNQNKLDQRIRLNNIALSDQLGEVEFFIHGKTAASGDGLKDTGRAGAAKVIRVPATTLDSFVEKNGIGRLDLLKIDTEGAELYIFRGAIAVINKFRPRIIFEASPLNVKAYGITVNDVYDFVMSLNYFIETVKGEEVSDASSFVRFATQGRDFVAIPTKTEIIDRKEQ